MTSVGRATSEDHRLRNDRDLVRTYLDELKWYPLLSRTDEVRLAQLIETGALADQMRAASPPSDPTASAKLEEAAACGRRAREEFAAANLRLVVSIAKRYQHHGVELADLIQEGNVGLMQAVERFDWRRGYKFSTYATWWIRKCVSQAVGDTGAPMRLPRHRREQAKVLADTVEHLERRLGRAPGTRELAIEAGIQMADVVAIRRAAAPVASMSAPIDEDGSELGELVADPGRDVGDAAAASALSVEIDHVLDHLSPSAAAVVRMRYGIGSTCGPRTASEVAAALSISPERVRQIELRALATLRDSLPRVEWAS